MSRTLFTYLIYAMTLAIGCQEKPAPTAPVASRQAASKLTVLIVDDPPLAAGLKLLRGEWDERTGGELEVREETLAKLLSARELAADLIIYPSRHVGTLVDRDWLRPIRDSVLQSDDVAINDIYPLIRNATLPYGGQVFAFTLGEPSLMLISRAKDQADAQPTTWEQIDFRLAADQSVLEHPLAVELLARGLAYSPHGRRSSGWFDAGTMQPRLASPPFVHAMQDMIAAWQRPGERSTGWIALGWPTSTGNKSPPIRYAPLPRAKKLYNSIREVWESNESDQPLVLLGLAGRSLSVSRATRNSASAFKLLRWLISENIATQLSPRSEATLWFRHSQVSKAAKWLKHAGVGDETATLIANELSAGECVLVPRIPGIDEYLAILQNVLATALAASEPAEMALAKVVRRWDALTEKYGRDRQRAAYRNHLGFDDSGE